MNNNRKVFTTKIELEKLCKNYSANKIATLYDVNVKTVYSLMKYYNLKTVIGTQGARKHKFNENYFNKIDSHEKAYWLGFIMADGCVYKGSDDNSFRLQINLKGDDKNHLEMFQKSIGSNYKLSVKPYKNTTVVPMKINSTIMCHDLINHGVVQRKSIICKYPIINEEFDKDYIRGYFDGDGCITRCHNGRWTFSIVGGNLMLEVIQKKLPITIALYKIKNKVIVSLETSSHKNINEIYKWLYSNSNVNIRLERKFKKYSQFYDDYTCVPYRSNPVVKNT